MKVIELQVLCDKLERQQKVLFFLVVILFGMLISLIIGIYTFSAEEIITTKGIVIVDEDGKDRILIGAPIPRSENRIRDDLKKVEDIYGPDFPPEANFMNLYKNKFESSTNGIVLLDKNGFDRIILDDPVPDPYFGSRIGPSTCLVINDSLGAERTS